MNTLPIQPALTKSFAPTKPKRVLLFEPGTGGHRPTILRYVRKVLANYGIESVLRTDQPKSHRYRLAQWLTHEAKNEGADLVHILTFDGLLAQCVPGIFAWREKFPIIATHYQYSNLKHGYRKTLFRAILQSNVIHRLMVSDPALGSYPLELRNKLSFLPDPWDPDDFYELPTAEARALLGIAEESVVFLAFGDLSERKGLGTILQAFRQACATNPKAELLLAGVPNDDWVAQLETLPAGIRSRIKTHFRFISEEDVNQYFFAADFVVSSYPAWFVISSGTFTRACAAGKPMLAASHGVVGQDIETKKIGLTHQTGNVDQLAANILHAVSSVGSPKYQGWSQKAKHLGLERTLDLYGVALLKAYDLVLSNTKSD